MPKTRIILCGILSTFSFILFLCYFILFPLCSFFTQKEIQRIKWCMTSIRLWFETLSFILFYFLSNPKSNATRCIKHPTMALVWKYISFIWFSFLSNLKCNATRCIKHPATALVWKLFLLLYFLLFIYLIYALSLICKFIHETPMSRLTSNCGLPFHSYLFILFYFIFFCLFILFRFILLLYDNIIDKSGLRNLN